MPTLPYLTDTSTQLTGTYTASTAALDNFIGSNYANRLSSNNSNYTREASNVLRGLINNKQDTLTASTNLLGIGTAITAIDYNKISVNKPTNFQADWLTTVINRPSTFPADMTDIYNKLAVNNLITNTSNYALNISNILKTNIDTNNNNISTNYFQKSGGTITGDTSVNANLTTRQLYINSTTSTASIFLNPVSTNYSILKAKTPWAMYFAEDYNPLNPLVLPNYINNGRNAVLAGTAVSKLTQSGNGASGTITYIQGTTGSTLVFPAGSIPSTFTILSLTRYTGATDATRLRILQSTTNNWLHGHWDKKRGVAFYVGWKTQASVSNGTQTDWLCCIGKNSGGTAGGNILVDGVAKGTDIGGTGNLTLTINTGTYGISEGSDWALSCVMIWDTELSDAEMLELNAIINTYKTTGVSIKSLIVDDTIIESRNYNGEEKTELLLFKGNDIAGTNGEDRIRLKAGSIAFDTYTELTPANNRGNENIVMFINGNGNVGIGTTTNLTYKLNINGSLNSTSLYQNGTLIDFSSYATNANLTNYLTSSTASSTYATITNLGTKESILTFSAPLTRTTNNISIDLSNYLTSSTASSTYATITNVNTKESILTFSAPLTRTTNNISIDLSSYLLSSTASSTYATITNLGTKESILTFSAPLTRTTNNISIDLSSYLLSSTASSTYATITNLGTKESILTFSAPLTRTTNTIGINLGSYSTTGNDANYLLKTGGTMTGQITGVTTLNATTIISGTLSTTNNTNVVAPTKGVYGGNGDRLVFWAGNSIVYPYSLGINDSTLWYSVPDGATHKFYHNGSVITTISSTGLSTTGTINASTNLQENGTNLTSKYLQLSGGTMTGQLQISASIYNGLYMTNTNSNDIVSIELRNNTTYNSFIGIGCTAYTGNYKNNLFIQSPTSLILNTNGNATAATPNFIINSNGNVGIGTTNPNNILQVGDGARLRISNGITDYSVIGTKDVDNNTNTRIVISGNTRGYTPGNIDYIATSTGVHSFYTTDSSTERMRIANNGTVTINEILSFGSRVQDYLIKLWGNDYGFGINGGTLRYNSGANHAFYSNGAFTVNINSIGLGIGIFEPFAPLCIGHPSVASDGHLVVSKNSGGNRNFRMGYDGSFNFCFGDYGNATSGNTWRSTDLSIGYSSGNVGIGTAPTYKRLEINGDTNCTGSFGITGDLSLYRGSGGVLGNLNCGGYITCLLYAIDNSGTEYVGVGNVSGNNQSFVRQLYIMFNTFTGVHRCFTNDELFDIENPQDFKNNYIGRIVVSTGKIATDIKSIDNDDWEIKYDKEGITIEDALPQIELSRKKKDKRVFGVMGSAKRGNSREERLIINSVGEGAIWVCNSNGNIENGDYITSSDYLGYGEKQDDDLLHNYTVAKATMDCNFELDSPLYNCIEIEGGLRIAFIAATYHCG